MDTVGQEKYNALNENFYKQANCCLLVYDITNKESFNKIKNYYVNKIKENCKSIVKVVLLGNKTDLNDKREVSDKDGHDLALQNEYIFMESSCKNNYNVSDAFTALVEMTNLDCTKEKNNNISLNQNKEGNNDDRCC
jgi:small GTP-binding protein